MISKQITSSRSASSTYFRNNATIIYVGTDLVFDEKWFLDTEAKHPTSSWIMSARIEYQPRQVRKLKFSPKLLFL
jgi:hypothetical protein